MVSEQSVLRPEAMADATRFSVMSKQIEDNKQATDELRSQMADLAKSQADARKSLSHMDAMLSMLVSQSKGQTIHAPVLNSPPSGCLTNSTMTPLLPEPPDPPDFNQFGQRLSKLEFPVFDGTLLDCWIAKVDRIFELEQYGNEEKLDLISLSLEGAALKWFRRHRREFTDWTDIKRKLMARFGLVKGFVMECEDATISGGETNVETKSLLEKETIPSSVLCDQVPATQSQDNNMTQQEELIQDIETIREIGLIQEHESPKLTDAIMEVDCVHSQEFSSQFQVPIPSLEPSRRCHKESLVVVNDLSYDHGCVTSKTIGSIFDFELGQDNSLDEEEFKGFKLGKLSKNERRLSAVCRLEKKEVTKTISAWNNRVWEPGGVLIERDKWKWSGKCHELRIVVRLMQGLYSTRWSYGKVAVLSQELQQPKTYLKEIKLKELDRLIACSSVGTETWLVKCSCEYKIQKLLLCYHSLKVQEKQLFPEDNVGFPEVSIISMRKGLVCDKEKKRLRNVKAAGCICDVDQVNSLDEEEYMGFTEFSKPQLAMEFLLLNSGLFMNTRLLHDKINSVFVALALLVVSEHNKAIRTRYEKAEKVDKHKINFTVAVIDEPKDIKTACVFMEMSLNRERLIQLGAPPVFIDLLCAMNRIQVRLKMVLLLEFLWLTLFTSKMFKSSNVHQNKNQTDQKLSSYWKLLLRLLHPLHSNRWGNFCLLVIKPLFKGKEESVSFNVAVTSCSSYVKVLELIKDRDSRKRKLGKNWWFKFKLNTLPSETLHLWRKRKSEKLQRVSKHMICELVQNSWDMSIFGKSRTWLLCKMRILHDLKDLRQFTRVKFHLKHKWRSKFGSNKLTRTWTRQRAWLRILPKLHLGAFSSSFLRTRMFSNREYCDRKSSKPYHLNFIFIYLNRHMCVNRYLLNLETVCKEKPHLSQA